MVFFYFLTGTYRTQTRQPKTKRKNNNALHQCVDPGAVRYFSKRNHSLCIKEKKLVRHVTSEPYNTIYIHNTQSDRMSDKPTDRQARQAEQKNRSLKRKIYIDSWMHLHNVVVHALCKCSIEFCMCSVHLLATLDPGINDVVAHIFQRITYIFLVLMIGTCNMIFFSFIEINVKFISA